MDEDPLKSRVERWLSGQMPIINMHGGTSAVREADAETGEVVIELGGTCSSCGISSVTGDNITAELLKEFEEVEDVTVRAGGDDGWETDQAESVMGIDRTEGGRGGNVNPGGSNHF